MIDYARFRADWEADEGFRSHAYQDSEGYWTIGHGILIDKRVGGGITVEESRYLYENRLAICVRELERALPGLLESLDEARGTVLVEMAMNLGMPRLRGFPLMIAALRVGAWDEAAKQMRNSRWYRQVGDRAERIATVIQYGGPTGD